MRTFYWMILVANSQILHKVLKVSKAGLVIQCSLLFLLACGKPEYTRLQGETMGTTFHITALLPEGSDVDVLSDSVKKRLMSIDKALSTYRADSEISHFNQAELKTALTVGKDFESVFAVSKNVYEKSGGAFDPSVAELISLWGFSKDLREDKPDEESIQNALKNKNFGSIDLHGHFITKREPVSIDFSAVAKGHAVDSLAMILREAGVKHYMVEIGGEIATLGNSPRGSAWRIGVEKPVSVRGQTSAALLLSEAALATSGDYRNYREIEGKRYSHTINPLSGYPIDHNLASVTVISDSVASADAWATALMVLGNIQGYELAEEQKIAAYFIYRDGDQFSSQYTPRFEAYLETP